MLQRNIPNSRAYFRTTKKMEQMIRKADKEVTLEAEKQVDILYHAAALALYRYHGWKSLRIERFAKVSEGTYDECGSDNDLSMLQMLDSECGIELMREDGNQSYKEVIYLNSSIDTGRPLTAAQWLAMRQNQIKWVPAQITASILLALHRKEGWGAERIGRFFQELENVKYEFERDPVKLREASWNETGFILQEEFVKS